MYMETEGQSMSRSYLAAADVTMAINKARNLGSIIAAAINSEHIIGGSLCIIKEVL